MMKKHLFVMTLIVLSGCFSVTAFALQAEGVDMSDSTTEDQARLDRQKRFEKRLEQIKSGEYKPDVVTTGHKVDSAREEIEGKQFRD